MRKKKKIFILFLTIVLSFCLCSVFFGCYNDTTNIDEKTEENSQPIGGMFYTLQQAYDKDIVSYDDLLSIAYYHHSESIYPAKGTSFNEGLMGDDFQPVIKQPAEIGDPISISIKQTIVDSCNESLSDSVALNNIVILSYYGSYNNALVVRIAYSADGKYVALNTVIKEDNIENITFYYSDFTSFFNLKDYDFSNEIMVWKADAL